MRRNALPEVLFLLVVIGISVGVMFMSWDFAFRAFLLPVIGAVSAILLAVYQLIRVALGKEVDVSRPESAVNLSSAQAVPGDATEPSNDAEVATATTEPLAPHWRGLFWLALFTGLVYLLGLAVGALVFTVVYMRLRARDGLFRIALVVATLAVVLLGLVYVLGARIYGGLLF